MALDESLPYQDLTYKVTGAAMYVHRELRHGLREDIYHTALQHRLAEVGINFVQEYTTEVVYQGRAIGLYRLDFWVEEKLVVELKAFSHMTTNEEIAQCLRYMQVTGAKLGLLLNFGRPSLERHRITPPLTWADYNPRHDRWLRTEGFGPLPSDDEAQPNRSLPNADARMPRSSTASIRLSAFTIRWLN